MSKITLRRKTYIQHTPVTFLPVANDDDSHLEDLHKARNGNSIIGFFRCVSYPLFLVVAYLPDLPDLPEIGDIRGNKRLRGRASTQKKLLFFPLKLRS